MKPDPEVAAHANAALAALFARSKAQFGNAIKSFWFYDGDSCPACQGEIDTARIKGQEVISLNAFIYRKRGVLIGYILCGRCAGQIFLSAEQRPGRPTPLHLVIEGTLTAAYDRRLASMDA